MRIVFCCAAMMMAASAAYAVNYDESKVPKHDLPDPLVMADGTRVTDAKTWQEKQRPAILKMVHEHMYGVAPAPPIRLAVAGPEHPDAKHGENRPRHRPASIMLSAA